MIEIQNQQNQTPEALKSALEIHCGDLGKSGPGPKAKADARNAMTNRAKANPPSAKGKSGSILVDGFTPNPHRYRPTPKVQKPLQAQNRPDLSKSNMSDVTIKVEKEEVQFKTPESLTDRVQDVSKAE